MRDSFKYQWVLFDQDNTIFDFDLSEIKALKKTFEDFNLVYQDEYLEQYHSINKQCWRAYEEGKMSRSQLRVERFDRYLNVLGIKCDPALFGKTYLQNLSNTGFLIQDAVKLLEILDSKINMAVITNGLKEVQRPRIKRLGFNRFFQAIIVSDEIGYSKPDAAFFEYTFDAINNPEKDKVLVVGDNLYSDIKGGNNYGLDTCWFNYNGQENKSDQLPTYEIHHLKELLDILELL